MSKASVVDTQPPITLLANTDVVADALAALAATVSIHDAYQQMLRLRFGIVEVADQKAARRHQKVLLAQPAMQILLIVWKESPIVSDDSIDAAYLDRDFSPDDPINVHSLAKRLAEDVDDFERQQKRVKSVVAAGEIYGYIVRGEACRSKSRGLMATSALHELMTRLGKRSREIFARAVDYDLGPLA